MKHLFVFLLSFVLLSSCSKTLTIHVVDSADHSSVKGARLDTRMNDSTFTDENGYATVRLKRKEVVSIYRKQFDYGYLYSRAHRAGDTVVIRLSPPYVPEDDASLKREDSINEVLWNLEDAAYPALSDFTKKDSSAMMLPEITASFPGDREAMVKWLQANLEYPQYSVEMEEQGKVYVQFVVEADGNVTNVRAINHISYHIDRSAKQVVRKMPNWNPAVTNGVPVRSYFNLPLTYKLQ